MRVEHALALLDGLNQLARPIDLIEVLIEVHGDEVALGGRAVPVDTAFKKSSKLSEQTIFRIERGVRQGGAILSRGFSDDEGDVVVLVVGIEGADFVDDGVGESTRRQMPMPPKGLDQPAFSKFFA